MPPDRGRASQACNACRKQKTRCYGSGTPGGACHRCDRLQQSCSLSGTHHVGAHGADDVTAHDARLRRLEMIVQRVEERLDEISPSLERSPMNARGLASANLLPPTMAVRADIPNDSSTAPVFTIRNIARELEATPYDQPLVNAVRAGKVLDIIDNGLIEFEDASSLITLFLKNYGRWVAINENTPSNIIFTEIRKSPLLLCACCLIAVRHTTQEHASRLAPGLFQEAKSLLSTELLVVPQSIQFFQATLVMSLWSTTIGQALLSIDSWLLSSFSLQHCLSSDLFSPITTITQVSTIGPAEAEKWFIWNHLCLVHLHYCVGTRRKAQLDREQIDQCRRILDSDLVTNFETRMVAEVNLYWIIYESCSRGSVDVPGTQSRLSAWKNEWKFLFDQPRPQFIQMGFHFAQLLIYEQALNSRSASVRESLLSEMVRLSAAILTLAMETADIRTQHLSDHIYHIITFAAITLCRLLHKYEDQLTGSHNVAELDQLVSTLVTWLSSIGLPCHVAHKLSEIVSAFHEKLRPNARPTPMFEEDSQWQQDLTGSFPDLGTDLELFYSENGEFFPDWAPFVPGPAT